MASQNLLVLVLLCVMAVAVAGTVYPAGGSGGWGLNSDIQALTLQQGDSVQFTYAAGVHTVIQVSQTAFEACDASDPWDESTDGSALFTFDTAGAYYFICSKVGHCSAGMKLPVYVQS